MYGRPEIIQDEFRSEVGELHYHVSDMIRYACDVADDLRAAAAGMITALCMATAREFRIVQGDTEYQTLIVWEKGPEGCSMSANSVVYARTFRNRGEAWGTLAGILARGDRETVSDFPGNQAGELRQAGALDYIVRALGNPGIVMVLDSSEPMSSSVDAFQLLFGGDPDLWREG